MSAMLRMGKDALKGAAIRGSLVRLMNAVS